MDGDEWRINDCNLSLHRWNKGYCCVVNNRDFLRVFLKLHWQWFCNAHEMVKIILISLIHCTHTHVHPLPFYICISRKEKWFRIVHVFQTQVWIQAVKAEIMLMRNTSPCQLQAHCSFCTGSSICSITKNTQGRKERLTCLADLSGGLWNKEKKEKHPEQNSLFFFQFAIHSLFYNPVT